MECQVVLLGFKAKTVIPAKAVAKVSMRLVPDMMQFKESFAKYKAYVESLTPEGSCAGRAADPCGLRSDCGEYGITPS